MVERFFNFLNKELNGLHQSALLLAFSALASQVLALVRDRLLAARFGAGLELDIYYAAFRLPDLLFVAFSSLMSAAVLIPFIFRQLGPNNDYAAAGKFLSSLLTIFLLTFVVVAALLFGFLPVLSRLVAPGLDPSAQKELVLLSRILLLSPLLLNLSNLFGAVTQSLRRFFVCALSPVLYNLGIIFGVLILAPLFGLSGLVWGVVLGAALHFAINVPSVLTSGFPPRLTNLIDWHAAKEVLLVSLPRTLALSAHQLALLTLLAWASFMAAGSVAVFNFALNLQSVPLVVIGMSYSVAAFPILARLFESGERQAFLKQVVIAVRHIIFWSMPTSVFFIILRAQIVRVVLGTGQFDWQDTRLTAALLAVFVLSLTAQSLAQLFLRAYYASGRTFRPLLLNLISAGLTVLLGFLLFFWVKGDGWWLGLLENVLRVEGLSGTAVVFLSLAFSVGMLVNLALFWFVFQKDFGRFPAVVDLALIQSFVASLLGGLTAYLGLNILSRVLDLNSFLGVAGQGALSALAGLTVFFLVLRWWGNEELKEIMRSVRSRFWRSKPLAPEPEEL